MMNEFINTHQKRVEHALETLLTPHHDAMRYVVLNGGKRLRALLVYATGQLFDTEKTALDAPACAVELIHAYSLVHDDLPAMDNSPLRRGKPSCHKQFDEATAILVGDALQCLAFELLAEASHNITDKNKLSIISTLSKACGIEGMVQGQMMDLAAENKAIDITTLENIHALKTGQLFRASVKLGALASNCEKEGILKQLDTFATLMGQAFQIQDDVLDIESDSATLGKPQGLDVENKKATYPAVIGMDASKTLADSLYQESLDALAPLGPSAEALRTLIRQLQNRKN